MGKSLSVQATERIGKQWNKAKLTREGKLQHLKAFARFVAQRYGLERIENLKTKHVAAYVENMQNQGLSAGTMANRLAALRELAAAIGKANIVCRTNAEYGINRIRQSPVSADRESIDGIKAQLAARAQDGDRIALMAHAAAALRDAFGLRAKESLLSTRVVMRDGELRLVVEGAKGGRPRELQIRTEGQAQALQLAHRTSQSLGSATGRLIPPELSLKAAYDAQRALWRELGGNRRDASHMHAQRHDYLQKRHAEGATRQELMHEAGHGEDRSPGSYLPT